METLPEIRINFGGSFAQETPGPHLQKEKKIHQTCTQDRPSNMPKSEVHSSNKPVEKPKPEVHHSIGFVEKSKPEVHLSDELVKELKIELGSTCSSGGSVHFTNLQQNGNANKGFLTCECECESMKMERPGRELGFKEAAIKNLDIQLDGRDNEIQENTGHFERALSDRGCTHIGCGPSGRALQGASNVCSGRSIKRLGDELARLKAENRYLKRELQQFNPTVSQEVEDLKLECKELSKVCTYYAGLLHSYSERLGLPFKPLSHVHVDITSETYDALIDPI